MAKKKVKAIVKLQLPAGEATMAPPVGPALSQHQINGMEFVKAFNAQTANQKGTIFPVEITIYVDKSFSFIIKTPPTSFLIKKAAGLEKGSGEPNKNKVGKLTMKQVREIAEQKMPDLNAGSIEAAMSMVMGTARSMGVEIEEG